MNKKETNQRKLIANNIKKYLRIHKMSQKELSSKIGIRPSTMSDYMNLRATPSHGVVQKIADVFKVPKTSIDSTYEIHEEDLDPDIRTLNRAALDMTPKQRKQAIEILEETFEDLFDDEDLSQL